MNTLKKLIKALAGIFLMMRCTKMFDTDILRGKRIAIVGPASSAYKTGRGQYIDDFHYVIRINKAPAMIKQENFREDIGLKTDILFHSFFENEFSGGGPLNFALYDELGIKYVINPIPTFFGKRATFNFYKKYLLRRTVYTLRAEPYKKIIRAFDKFRPTTGFCALKMALDSEFDELFITGFTFFKTAYGDGYRDSLKDVAVNRKYIAESNIHSPDIEYEQFKQMLQTNRHKRIMTDKELKAILERDGIIINAV